MSKRSFVWDYFELEGKSAARCKFENCKKLMLAGCGTSNLANHLKKIHGYQEGNQVKETREAQSSNKSSTSASNTDNSNIEHLQHQEKRQKTILSCFKYRSFEETIARLAAENGLTFKQITQSVFIQNALARDFPNKTIPKSQNTMATVVEGFYEQVKEQIIRKLNSLKQEGQRFSLTLDEWTSHQNFRYININIHYSVKMSKTSYINLGMVKIEGTCSAEKMVELVNNKLAEFDLESEKDIITATEDVRSVMVSFGRKMPFEFLICFNHTIHLSVLASLFPKKVKVSDEHEISIFDIFDIPSEDDPIPNEEEISSLSEDVFEIREEYSQTIERMIKIIKFFKTSPVQNSILQESLKQLGIEQLKPILFIKTRWNSLVISAKRFILLLPGIMRTLMETENDLPWENDDTIALKHIVEVLECAMISIEALSKDSINLIEGEVIMKSLVAHTSKMNSFLAREFHEILIGKLLARRNAQVSTLIMYLADFLFLSEENTGLYPLKLESKKAVQQLGSNMLKRLYDDEPTMSFQEILKLFDLHKKRSPLLEKLFLSLCSAQPTSTQSERNFSLSSTIISKLNSSLSPEYVDKLCFLKSFFMSDKK